MNSGGHFTSIFEKRFIKVATRGQCGAIPAGTGTAETVPESTYWAYLRQPARVKEKTSVNTEQPQKSVLHDLGQGCGPGERF